MGKQAKKKKPDAQSNNQKKHNRSTRGINTKRSGAVWAIRRYKAKDKDGEEVERKHYVTIPVGTLWDPFDLNKNDKRKAVEPFDALHLDWREEMMEYAADNNARIGKIELGDGEFLYRVYQGENVGKPDRVFFELQSTRKFVDVRDVKKRKRAKKVG